MKRLSAFILLIIYFITTTGATLQLHYCMGQYTGWSVAAQSGKKCDKCGMKKKRNADNGCCKDEHKLIKIDDDQKANSLSFEISKIIASALVISDYTTAVFVPAVKKFLPKSNAPPRSSTTSLHIANCVFLI